MNSKIDITIQDADTSPFYVWTAEIHEGISQLYRGEVGIASVQPFTAQELKKQFFGRKVTLTLWEKLDNGIIKRYLNGVITGYSLQGAASFHPGWDKRRLRGFERAMLFSLKIEPVAAAMKSTVSTQDYPDTTPLKTVCQVFQRNGIEVLLDSAFIQQEKYKGHFRFFQQNESDFDFVSRIMARYGISYCFTHSEGKSEQLYLSDGEVFPAVSVLQFEDFPLELQKTLQPLSNQERYDFQMGNLVPSALNFTMQRFQVTSSAGPEEVRYSALHPMHSSFLGAMKGESQNGHIICIHQEPASFAMDVDDNTLAQGIQRSVDAAGASQRLQLDDWHGETSVLAAMPGKILDIHAFYTASQDDPPLSCRVTASDIQVTLDELNNCVYTIRFKAMDFSDELAEKRFCPPVQNSTAPSVPLIHEAIVCDLEGKTDNASTLNRLVPSPRSTPETPWLFMVKNDNPDAQQKSIDVSMTMPLGGKRAGLYRFPRVGDRVLILESEDKVTLLGYAPDRDTAFSEFPDGADEFGRRSIALRGTSPDQPANPQGRSTEIGFSYTRNAEEYMEQQIVDGTAYVLLYQKATNENNQQMRADLELKWKDRLDNLQTQYFENRSEQSIRAVTAAAQELVAEFGLSNATNRQGTMLSLFSDGTIFQYANKGIDIMTMGTLNISAADIRINGKHLLNLQSDKVVRSSVANSSITLNTSGIAVRSLKLTDAITRYDSAIYLNALDGVSISGANVHVNGLMSANLNDAMGGSICVENGVLMGAGAVVDMATIPLDTMNKSFEQLDEKSGLNKLLKIVSDWQAGTTPDGNPRSIADHRIGAYSKIRTIPPLHPTAKYRGTAASLALSTGQLARMDSDAGILCGQTPAGWSMLQVGSPRVTISTDELLRLNAFADMLDCQHQTVKTVTSSIMSGKSASVTIASHDLELNVENINNLSNQSYNNSSSDAGK